MSQVIENSTTPIDKALCRGITNGTIRADKVLINSFLQRITGTKHQYYDSHNTYFTSLWHNKIIDPFIKTKGYADGRLLEPLFGLEVGTYIFIGMDNINHSLLHVKYCTPNNLHLIDNRMFWFMSTTGIQEKDVILEDI